MKKLLVTALCAAFWLAPVGVQLFAETRPPQLAQPGALDKDGFVVMTVATEKRPAQRALCVTPGSSVVLDVFIPSLDGRDKYNGPTFEFGGIQVLFDGQPAIVESATKYWIQVTVPPLAGKNSTIIKLVGPRLHLQKQMLVAQQQ